MPKNKLTKKQSRLIANKQQNLGLDDNKLDNLYSGLVIAHYRDQVDIETTSSQSVVSTVRANLRQNLPPIAVGDQVLYQILNHAQTNQTVVITKLLERTSLLLRYNTNKALIKPIAANIDQIFIVFTLEPEPSSFLLDQFLINAESCNIKPILIFNKYDLYENYQQTNNRAIVETLKNFNELISVYSSIGYSILNTCTNQPVSIKAVKDMMANKNSIFVGQSGVGKSSIAQQILPNENIKIGKISEKSELGKHTTTVGKLYHIDNNGNLIDSPGIREIGISHLSRAELEHGYLEFRPYLNKCKFSNCRHNKEPECALKNAVESGVINPIRWKNYQKFCSNLKAE